MLTLLLSAVLLQGGTQPPSSDALAAVDRHFAETGGQALVVLHRGRVVHEQYRAGGAADRRQMLASGSKSFVGVATIAAVQDGVVSLDAPVARYLSEWRDDARKSRVTVRQLLSLESGIASGNPGTGCGGRGATWSDAVNTGTFAEPGSTFRYGPFPFIAMGAAIERVQPLSFERYLQQRVLDPLGVRVEWRARCGDGNPQLAGGAAMTARDWATFGEMIRRGGVHDGRRILDEALVRELFRSAVSNPSYGLSWWLAGAAVQARPALGPQAGSGGGAGGRPRLRDRLGDRRGRGRVGRGGNDSSNATAPSAGSAASAPGPALPAWLPRDLVMAAGAGNQRLYVVPSRELVVVRMGPIAGSRGFSDQRFLEALFTR